MYCSTTATQRTVLLLLYIDLLDRLVVYVEEASRTLPMLYVSYLLLMMPFPPLLAFYCSTNKLSPVRHTRVSA
ncbi:hypothetical protein V3C99_017389 [Haemonchus contortus]